MLKALLYVENGMQHSVLDQAGLNASQIPEALLPDCRSTYYSLVRISATTNCTSNTFENTGALRSATSQMAGIVEILLFHVRVDDIRFRVAFRVIKNLTIPVQLEHT